MPRPILAAFPALLGLASCFSPAPLGERGNPVKLYFTPSVDAETITSNSRHFVSFLERETGLHFKTGIPTSYIAVVEAFGSERADIGVMNSFGYIVANSKYGASAKLKVIRYGHDHYRGQILVGKDSGIKTLKDIAGKRFAYTDPSSTSGYMFPKKMLDDAGVKPGNATFARKHDSVVTMIYQGQVDAGATYHSDPAPDGSIRDARARVKTQFPDVEKRVLVMALTDEIPNDPFVFRKGLPPAITERFIAAVKKYLSTPEGKKTFETIYAVEGVVDTSDADYDGLRATIGSLSIDAEGLL